MRHDVGTGFWLAVAAFIGAVLIVGATLAEAIRVEDVAATMEARGTLAPAQGAPELPEAAPGEAAGRGGRETVETEASVPLEARFRAAGHGAYPLVTYEEILQAVNADLFQPDRTPPPERYRLPGEGDDSPVQSRDDRRRRNPDLRVVGTAISGNRALALVQPDDSIPFTVLLGEEVDGYLLAAVDEETVFLTRDGDIFQLPVVEPERGRSSDRRDRSSRDRDRAEETARMLNQRIQQAVEALRQQRGEGVQGQGFRTMGVPLRIEMRGGQVTSPRGVVIRGRGGGGGLEGGRLP